MKGSFFSTVMEAKRSESYDGIGLGSSLRRTFSNASKRRSVPSAASNATGISLSSHTQQFVFLGGGAMANEDSHFNANTNSQLPMPAQTQSNGFGDTPRSSSIGKHSGSGAANNSSSSLFAKLQAKSTSSIPKRTSSFSSHH